MTCHDGLMRRAFVAALAMLSAASCTSAPSGVGRTAAVVLHGAKGPVHVTVEVAETAGEREQGLMGRTSLGADEGMVFLWDDVADGPVTSEFWMKDTLIPLSIAFYDDRGRIVSLLDMEPCRAEPCPIYSPGVVYRGALEVNRGAFARWGVRVGDSLRLEQ